MQEEMKLCYSLSHRFYRNIQYIYFCCCKLTWYFTLLSTTDNSIIPFTYVHWLSTRGSIESNTLKWCRNPSYSVDKMAFSFPLEYEYLFKFLSVSVCLCSSIVWWQFYFRFYVEKEIDIRNLLSNMCWISITLLLSFCSLKY